MKATNNASSTYGLEYVVGNVRVNGGKWQYEARIVTTGQMQIGWCTTNYNPRVSTPCIIMHKHPILIFMQCVDNIIRIILEISGLMMEVVK